MRLTGSPRTMVLALAAILGFARVPDSHATTGRGTAAPDSSAVYSGVYASSFAENTFSACDVPGIGSGWWLRFANERDGAFLRYQYPRAGMPALSHFIRVRGRLSPPGHYGLGFNPREIVVDSVLEISEIPKPCRSYEDLPRPWEAIEPSGAVIIGAEMTDDRSLAAVFDLEGTISIWNTRRGELLKRFQSDDNGDLSWGSRIPMKFTHDGKRLAVGGTDGVVRVWNPVDGRRIWTFAASDTMPGTVNGKKRVEPSLAIEFNASGTLLANTVGDKVAIWSTVSGERLGTFNGGYWSTRLLFIGDSSFIASADSGLMKIYPRLGAQPIWRIRSTVQRFDVMDRSADGRWLVVKSYGDTAYIWSLSDGQPGPKIPIPNWFGMGAVAFSPDGNTIAMSGGANGLYLWDTKTGQPLRSFQKYPMGVVKAWFTADGKSIVSYSMSDSAFRIVHVLSPGTGLSGARNAEPVQAWWGANSWPHDPTPGRTLGSLTGFVRDSAKKAIVGAEVLMFDGDRPGSPPIKRTTTNAAGRFLLQGITVPHAAIRATKLGFAAGTRYTHLPAQGASVDFNLTPALGGS